jgi:hypothetical protein
MHRDLCRCQNYFKQGFVEGGATRGTTALVYCQLHTVAAYIP